MDTFTRNKILFMNFIKTGTFQIKNVDVNKWILFQILEYIQNLESSESRCGFFDYSKKNTHKIRTCSYITFKLHKVAVFHVTDCFLYTNSVIFNTRKSDLKAIAQKKNLGLKFGIKLCEHFWIGVVTNLSFFCFLNKLYTSV